eukprot:gene37580-55367_t
MALVAAAWGHALRRRPGGVRRSFQRCRRVLVKVGSNVLTNDEGRLAIGRIGELVEQVARMALGM